MTVRVDTSGAVRVLRLDRPDKKNALTQAMYAALTAGLDAADADPAVRVAVLAGGADFTAGNDLADFAAGRGEGPSEAFRFLEALRRFGKPLVAAVRGHAVGIGTTLLLHCDAVVAAQDAKLLMPFTKLGLVPEGGSSLLLARRVGAARARWWLMAAAPIPGQEAAEAGLVTRAVPDAENAIPRNRALYARALQGEAAPHWAEPFWSAAFISWLMAAAGVDSAEWAPSASHARYLDHQDALAAAFPATAPFLPRNPAAYAPEAGDLVCRDRSRRPLADWSQRAAERGQFRPMHCDLVVATGPGVVEAVGGNVSDAVALARFPADAAGRILSPMLVILQNRLGRLPPWSAENRS